MRKFLIVLAAMSFSGCAYLPWHPFGTPLSAEKRAEQRVVEAKARAGDALVEEVHKTKFAIDAAVSGAPESLNVAQQHARTAVTLVDQIHGSPTVIDETKWQDLIARQTSFDERVRRLANQESARRVTQLAKTSSDLEDKTSALASANRRASEYAAEKEAIADRFLKVCWIVGAIVSVFLAARLLGFLAQFFPALAPASQVIGSVVSKVLHPTHRQ